MFDHQDVYQWQSYSKSLTKIVVLVIQIYFSNGELIRHRSDVIVRHSFGNPDS